MKREKKGRKGSSEPQAALALSNNSRLLLSSLSIFSSLLLIMLKKLDGNSETMTSNQTETNKETQTERQETKRQGQETTDQHTRIRHKQPASSLAVSLCLVLTYRSGRIPCRHCRIGAHTASTLISLLFLFSTLLQVRLTAANEGKWVTHMFASGRDCRNSSRLSFSLSRPLFHPQVRKR